MGPGRWSVDVGVAVEEVLYESLKSITHSRLGDRHSLDHALKRRCVTLVSDLLQSACGKQEEKYSEEHWVTIRKPRPASKHISMARKGTVRTPTVALGH